MAYTVERQKSAYESKYGTSSLKKWSFHDTKDPLIRYLRDLRIIRGVQRATAIARCSPSDMDALVVCGGVGGEGTLLANMGFRSVTVSDLSASALEICKVRDQRLKTLLLNAEELDLPDESFDLILVQDGLHHLPRPALGFTEMLRVSRKVVIVNEPHTGLISRFFGRAWEYHGDEVNYVFRWNKLLFTQATRSYLLKMPCYISVIRLLYHSSTMEKLAHKLGGGAKGLTAVKGLFGLLNFFGGRFGNQMIGIVVKHP